MNSDCALCGLAVPNEPLIEEGHPFCCAGCLTVYKILACQGTLESYQTHPLFLQAVDAHVASAAAAGEPIPIDFEETHTFHFEIEGMWCPSCAEAIRLIMLRQKGIKRCIVDYATDLSLIEYAPRLVSKETILERIKRLGYHPQEHFSSEKKHVSRSLWVRFALAAFCALNLMMTAYPLYVSALGLKTEGYEEALGWVSLALSIPLVTYASEPIWRRFFSTALRTGHFGMETLVALGIITTFCYSTYQVFIHQPTHLYYDSMSMIITLVLLGKILELKTKRSAKETLFRLTRTLPNKGYKRVAPDQYAYVPLKEIALGDCLLARPGEKIVLDGVIEAGEGLVDESIMTGEALPKRKIKGSAVIGGSLVKQGALHYFTTVTPEKTLLSKMLHFIEHDLERKKRLYPFVDRLIPYFVPLIFFLALLVFPFGGIDRSLSVLLISCPCALGIAASLAESLMLYRFAEEGILVRNRAALFELAKDPLFVFDKTGTLTKGQFRVIQGLEKLSEKERSILKAMTQRSTHPVSHAICEELSDSSSHLDDFQEMAGKGLEAQVDGCLFRLGSFAFISEWGLAATDCSSSFTTVVYFVEKGMLPIAIHLGDELRSNIPSVDGVVLSGDHPALAAHVAAVCGFRWGKGGCSPIQKRDEIETLKGEGRPIVMVGDGINDASALAAADVGISVVSASDASIEVSDLFLTTDKLDALPMLCRLATRGRRIIHQNLFWAFFYNGVGIGLAFAGLLTPLFSAAAMMLSSVCVTLNSLRLKKKS